MRTLQARELSAWARAAGGAVSGSGLTALTGTVTDPADRAEERIDYIFVLGPGMDVTGARAFLDRPFPREGGGVLWASDHVGVLAGVRVR